MLTVTMHRAFSYTILSSATKRNHTATIRSLSSSSAPSTSAPPVVELREYVVYPELLAQYQRVLNRNWDRQSAAQTRESPLKLSVYPETGGNLFSILHFYLYPSLAQRHHARQRLHESGFIDHSKAVRNCVKEANSQIFVEAPLVSQMDEVWGLANHDTELEHGKDASSSRLTAEIDDDDPEVPQQDRSGIFELRRYQLQLGYDTVPRFLDAYQKGLPHKLHAPNTHPTTRLVTVLTPEVGTLNQVLEIWRHQDESAMQVSREAARDVAEWKATVAEIATLAQTFTTSIHRPYAFSHWQ